MTPQKQAFHHRPEQGEFGDCARTCLACMLDLDRDTVPNFGEHHGDGHAFKAAVDEFLASQNLRQMELAYAGDMDLDKLLDVLGQMWPGIYILFSGESRTGVNHMVIIKDGEIFWDPSLTDAGIVGPCDDGYYWVTLLISTQFVAPPAGSVEDLLIDDTADAPSLDGAGQ